MRPAAQDTEPSRRASRVLLDVLHHETIVAGVLFSLLLFGQRDALNLPYHWDAMAAVFDYSDAIFKQRLWPFPLLPFDDPGHPPFYYEVLALAWTLGGQRPTVAHYVGLAFAWLALLYTYRFGRNVLESSPAGVLAAIFLLFNPLSFAQWGHLNNEVAFTALFVMTTYYLALDRGPAFALCGSAFTLTKAYGVIFVLIIIGLGLLLFDRRRLTFRRLLCLTAPLFVYAAWFLLHRHFTGVWLNAPRFSHVRGLYSTVGEYFMSFQERLSTHFVDLNGLLSLSCLLAVVWAWSTADRRARAIHLLVGAVAIGFLFLSALKSWIPRYAMVIYPHLFLVAALAISRLLEARRLPVRVLGLIIVAVSLTAYAAAYDLHRTGYGSFEENSEYIDVIRLNMDVCRYIEAEYPDATILASWPLSHALANPALGYVSTPARVVSAATDHYDLFLYTAAPESEPMRGLRAGKSSLVRRFERNGKVVELHRRL